MYSGFTHLKIINVPPTSSQIHGNRSPGRKSISRPPTIDFGGPWGDPGGFLEGSRAVLGGAWEVLGSILEAFGK